MPTTRFALLYAHLASNHGDTAVTLGAIDLLRVVAPAAGITLVAPKPSRFGEQALDYLLSSRPNLEVHKVEVDSYVDAIKAAMQWTVAASTTGDIADRVAELSDAQVPTDCETVVSGGGEHLFTDGSSQQDAAFLSRVLPLLAASRSGRRVIVLPTTIGPVASPVAREALRLLDDTSSTGIVVREPNSRHVLTNVLQDGKTKPVAADPAFFLSPRDDLTTTLRSRSRETVVVAPRLDAFGLRVGLIASREASTIARRTRYRSSVAFAAYSRAIRAAIDAGCDIRMVAQSDADRGLCDALAHSCYDLPGQPIPVLRPGSLDELLNEYARARAILTSRFHSMVFGAMLGIPTTAIVFPEHGHKTPGLARMLGDGYEAISAREDLERAIASLVDHAPRLPNAQLENVKTTTLALLRRAISGT